MSLYVLLWNSVSRAFVLGGRVQDFWVFFFTLSCVAKLTMAEFGEQRVWIKFLFQTWGFPAAEVHQMLLKQWTFRAGYKFFLQISNVDDPRSEQSSAGVKLENVADYWNAAMMTVGVSSRKGTSRELPVRGENLWKLGTNLKVTVVK